MAKKKEEKSTDIKVKILCHNMAGKYLLPHSYGNIVVMEEKQAKEIIEAGDGEKA